MSTYVSSWTGRLGPGIQWSWPSRRHPAPGLSHRRQVVPSVLKTATNHSVAISSQSIRCEPFAGMCCVNSARKSSGGRIPVCRQAGGNSADHRCATVPARLRSISLRIGKGSAHLLLGLVDDLSRVADLNQPRETERTTSHVLDQTLDNYSDLLRGGRQIQTAPRLVRRAEHFLEANATKPITISDVVAECGCSRRALFNAFRQHRGYAPLQFLAVARLKSARNALLCASPTDNVSSIAFACGFSHLGRFAEAYRKRFGEKPSETMRRA